LVRSQINTRLRLTALRILLCLSVPTILPAQSVDLAARIHEISDALLANDAAATRQENTRLIQERADLLYGLTQQDPAKAVGLALRPESADRLRAAYPQVVQSLETEFEVQSPATILVSDDAVHHTSRTFARMKDGDKSIDVYFAGQVPAGAQCGATLRARGIRIRDRMVVVSAKVISRADSLGCSTTGDQKVAVLLVTFPGTTDAAPSLDATHEIFFSSTQRSVDSFWRANSNGKTSASGDVFGVYTLDRAYDCSDPTALWNAAILAASPYVNFTAYNRFFLFFPDVVNCSFTGLGTLGCSTWTASSGTFTGSVAWEMWSALRTQDGGVSLSAHEGGHNLGLEHSRSLQFAGEALGPPGATGTRIEYGDPYPAMAYAPGNYAAPHKAYLGWWTSPSNYQVVQTPGVYTIQASETLPAGLSALKVLRGTGGNAWLWLEYRQPSDASDSLLHDVSFSGAIVHYENATTSNYTDVLDFNPQTPDLNDVPLSFWSDPYSDLTLRVLSTTDSQLTVSVEYGSSSNCERVIPSVTLSTTATQVSPGGSVDFSLMVRNNDSPICQSARTFQLASPQPDGWTSTLSSSAVSLAPQQSTTITLTKQAPVWAAASQYQAVIIATATAPENSGSAISQIWVSGASAPQPIAVAPASGKGSFSRFTFAFSDDAGYGDILSASILFNSSITFSSACHIVYVPGVGANYFQLANDGETAYSTPVGLGSSSSAENSQCRIFGAGSSASGSGKQLQVTLMIAFKPSFAGAKNVYLYAQNNFQVSGWQPYGTWTVASVGTIGLPSAPSPVSGASAVSSITTLRWTDAVGASWYDVYFGTSPSPGLAGTVLTNSYGLEALAPNTTYYWKVVAGNGAGTISSPVWSFTTAPGLWSYAGGLPHVVAEQGWSSAITLVNTANVPSRAQWQFLEDDGTPQELPLAQLQTVPSAPLPIPDDQVVLNAGASVVLSAGNSWSSAEGQVQFFTDQSINGNAIYRYEPSGQELAVPFEKRNASSYVIAFDNTGAMVTGIAIADFDSLPTDITGVVRGEDGGELGTMSIPLSGRGHTSFLLADQCNVTAGIRGTVEFTASGGRRIGVTAIRASGIALTSLPAIARTDPAGGAMAQITSGSDWQTTFTLVNTGGVAATANLNFFDDSGTALSLPVFLPQTGQRMTVSGVSQYIPAGGSLVVILESQPGTAAVAGSAMLTTTGNISGFAIFRYNPSGQEAVVPLLTLNTPSYILPFDNTSNVATGLAVANLASQPAHLNVVLRNEAGAQIGTGVIFLPALGHTSFMLTDTASGGWAATAGVRGTIEIDTPPQGHIAPLGLRAAAKSGGFTVTTIPVMQP